MVAWKCLPQTLFLTAYSLLIQTVTCNCLRSSRLPAPWRVSTCETYWRLLGLVINQSCLKTSTVHVICKMDFELAWEQPSSPSILFLLSGKCCPFSLPNQKPWKNCHWQIVAAYFLQDQRSSVHCPCQPDVIHSLSQVDVTCDCCYWLYQALQPVCPRDSTGAVLFSPLSSLPRQEGRRMEKAIARTGRKSLCLINSHPKPAVRKLLHLSISKKTTAKCNGEVWCMHV